MKILCEQKISTMDAAKWTNTSVGANPETVQTYAEKFSSAEISLGNLFMIYRDTLKELGITMLDDILTILKLGKTQQNNVKNSNQIKLPSIKAPQIQADMTKQQFRKFRVD